LIKDTQYERVRYLLEKVPATRSNDLLLILMYWKVFDNIPISNETIRAILDRGALPDSITRYKRDVIKVEKELKRLKEMTG
jgi:hypothetical protein